MKIKDINKIIEEVPSIITKNEGLLLYKLAEKSSSKGVIVEIGSYKGGSAIILAKGSLGGNRQKVYTIDPHIRRKGMTWGRETVPLYTFDMLMSNIKKHKMDKMIVPIKKTSKKAAKRWKKPISLLWIDGDHTYNSVKSDFLMWEKYLIKGGVIAFHDSANANSITPATGKVNTLHGSAHLIVRRYVRNSRRFRVIKVEESTTIAIKTKNSNILGSLIASIDLHLSPLRTIVIKIDECLGRLGNLVRTFFPDFSTKK